MKLVLFSWNIPITAVVMNVCAMCIRTTNCIVDNVTHIEVTYASKFDLNIRKQERKKEWEAEFIWACVLCILYVNLNRFWSSEHLYYFTWKKGKSGRNMYHSKYFRFLSYFDDEDNNNNNNNYDGNNGNSNSNGIEMRNRWNVCFSIVW